MLIVGNGTIKSHHVVCFDKICVEIRDVVCISTGPRDRRIEVGCGLHAVSPVRQAVDLEPKGRAVIAHEIQTRSGIPVDEDGCNVAVCSASRIRCHDKIFSGMIRLHICNRVGRKRAVPNEFCAECAERIEETFCPPESKLPSPPATIRFCRFHQQTVFLSFRQ